MGIWVIVAGVSALVVGGAAIEPNSAPNELRAAPHADTSQTEIVFWQSIEGSTNPDDFRAYISKYPDGSFVSLARNRLSTLSDGSPGAANGQFNSSRWCHTDAGAGSAKVFVYLGDTIWPGGSSRGVPPIPFDLSVDAGKLIRLRPKSFVEFDVPPGSHEITRYPVNLWIRGQPANVTIELSRGECAYLSLNHYQRLSPADMRVGILFGAIGGGLLGALSATGEVDGHRPGDWLVIDPAGASRVAKLRPQ